MERLADMETKLRQWRGVRRVDDVASQIGVTVPMWSRWETGRRSVPAQRVLDLEALTGISRYELRPDIFGPAPGRKAHA